MDKSTVVLIMENESKHIETYFPNELASMFVSHGFIAVVLPVYLKRQAI